MISLDKTPRCNQVACSRSNKGIIKGYLTLVTLILTAGCVQTRDALVKVVDGESGLPVRDASYVMWSKQRSIFYNDMDNREGGTPDDAGRMILPALELTRKNEIFIVAKGYDAACVNWRQWPVPTVVVSPYSDSDPKLHLKVEQYDKVNGSQEIVVRLYREDLRK